MVTGACPEELLDREVHDRGIVDEALLILGMLARCHSDDPIADHVVVDAGDEQQDDHPADDVVVDRLSVELDRVSRELVEDRRPRVHAVVLRPGRGCSLPRSSNAVAAVWSLRDALEDVVNELAEEMLVLEPGSRASRPMTLTGMFWAYATAASITVSPGVTSRRAGLERSSSTPREHVLRTPARLDLPRGDTRGAAVDEPSRGTAGRS